MPYSAQSLCAKYKAQFQLDSDSEKEGDIDENIANLDGAKERTTTEAHIMEEQTTREEPALEHQNVEEQTKIAQKEVEVHVTTEQETIHTKTQLIVEETQEDLANNEQGQPEEIQKDSSIDLATQVVDKLDTRADQDVFHEAIKGPSIIVQEVPRDVETLGDSSATRKVKTKKRKRTGEIQAEKKHDQSSNSLVFRNS